MSGTVRVHIRDRKVVALMGRSKRSTSGEKEVTTDRDRPTLALYRRSKSVILRTTQSKARWMSLAGVCLIKSFASLGSGGEIQCKVRDSAGTRLPCPSQRYQGTPRLQATHEGNRLPPRGVEVLPSHRVTNIRHQQLLGWQLGFAPAAIETDASTRGRV